MSEFYRQGLVSPDLVVHYCMYGKNYVSQCRELLDIVITKRGFCYQLTPAKAWPNMTIDSTGSDAALSMQLMVDNWNYAGQSDTPGEGFKVREAQGGSALFACLNVREVQQPNSDPGVFETPIKNMDVMIDLLYSAQQ